ncbi:hypothetical protein SL1157_A0078 [Ruegeria lacuscaerulensis ITI-1157]|nr:hypothetical protein SL1157_A0078 [Ruegeria lacuscaerulensis ITI-1157]
MTFMPASHSALTAILSVSGSFVSSVVLVACAVGVMSVPALIAL